MSLQLWPLEPRRGGGGVEEAASTSWKKCAHPAGSGGRRAAVGERGAAGLVEKRKEKLRDRIKSVSNKLSNSYNKEATSS